MIILFFLGMLFASPEGLVPKRFLFRLYTRYNFSTRQMLEIFPKFSLKFVTFEKLLIFDSLETAKVNRLVTCSEHWTLNTREGCKFRLIEKKNQYNQCLLVLLHFQLKKLKWKSKVYSLMITNIETFLSV